MKKVVAFLAAACVLSSAMAGVTCVYVKNRTLPNGYLALAHPVSVYADADLKTQHRQLTGVGSFYVTERRNGFIRLADPKYFETNPAHSFAGWAKASDFDEVAYRNCSAASAE
jgi:hypothetical protein